MGKRYYETENFEQNLKFTTVNQTWFKFLALVSFLCALFVYAALIWLIVCRPNRLPKTDEQIKKEALEKEKIRKKRKHCSNRRRNKLKQRLKYVILGNLKVKSPSYLSEGSSTNEYTSSQQYLKVENEKEKKSKNKLFKTKK